MTETTPAPISLFARRMTLAVVLVAVALFISQLVEIPWRSALRGHDNTFNYLWLRSAMIGGDWDFRDDLLACNTLDARYRKAALDAPLTDAGLLPNKYGIGWAVVSLPFYLIADGLTATGRAIGLRDLQRDGYGPVYQIILQTGHFLLAILSVRLGYLCLRRWFNPEAALLGVLITWSCSPLLYYQTSNLSMSHGVGFFAVMLCLWALLRAESRPAELRWWALAGAAVSLAAVTRFQLAIVGLLPVGLWLTRYSTLPRPWRAAVACAVAALPLVMLQLFAWKTVYGHWLVFSYGENEEGFNFLQPALLELLFSPYHGFLYWHPFLLFGVVGMFLFGRHRPWPGLPLVALTLITIYMNAAWWCWWFGASFGQRAFDCVWPGLMVGLGWLLHNAPPSSARRLIWFGAAMAAVNLVLLLMYRTNLVPRNAPVTWFDVLRGGL